LIALFLDAVYSIFEHYYYFCLFLLWLFIIICGANELIKAL